MNALANGVIKRDYSISLFFFEMTQIVILDFLGYQYYLCQCWFVALHLLLQHPFDHAPQFLSGLEQ